MIDKVKARPCEFCPYRRDVPSGVWSHNEYEKLREYDAPTGEQPFGAFACHAQTDQLCHGWAVCHTSRGNEYDLLALRLAGVTEVPEAAVPLFASGNDAADHGQYDIDDPDPDAQRAVDKLVRHYPRLELG